MDAVKLIQGLDGAPFEKSGEEDWPGLCEGRAAIENVKIERGVITFDLIVPTDEYDSNDYIWRSEVEEGSTNKVVLKQGGKMLEQCRICAIARETAPDSYRLSFEVQEKSLADNLPLEVLCYWDDKVLAIARGTS